MIAIFWLSILLLFFTYLGYPLLIAVLARRTSRSAPEDPDTWPGVSVVLVAYNEAERLPARLKNLLAADYPAEQLQVIVVSDGSTDATPGAIQAIGDSRIQLITQPERVGKASGLNAGVAAATGSVIVFADARQTFAADTIRHLVRAVQTPGVGAATGELEIAGSEAGVGQAMDAYWKLERFLRAKEAVVDSCIGCTGAVYAIRRALYRPIPADTVLDDVVIPMQIAVAGHRVDFRPEAKAFDPQTLAPEKEARRKQRTLAGNFQMLFRHPGWLLPTRNRLWWQLIAHKYLRLAAPVFLVTALVSNIALRPLPFYGVLLWLHLGFYALALLGTVVKARCCTIPAGFLFLNVNVVRAFWHYLTAPNIGAWAGPRTSVSVEGASENPQQQRPTSNVQRSTSK